MPRPVKCRRVAALPGVIYFKPAGIPMRELEETCLSVEEMEALRLKEIESMDQESCARQMGISRPTFQRVLYSARKKLADALLNGKAIRIEGGNFRLASQRWRCARGHEWNIPFISKEVEALKGCPECKTSSVSPLEENSVTDKLQSPVISTHAGSGCAINRHAKYGLKSK